MSIVACPTCGTILREIRKELDKRLSGLRDINEKVWFCPKCKIHLFEEDFLYSTEEE